MYKKGIKKVSSPLKDRTRQEKSVKGVLIGELQAKGQNIYSSWALGAHAIIPQVNSPVCLSSLYALYLSLSFEEKDRPKISRLELP